MKQAIYILITFLELLSCDYRPKQVDKTANDFAETANSDNSKYYSQQDTVIIVTEIGDTLKYAKSDFNKIVDTHTELFEEYPYNPDQTYINGDTNIEFGSEAGKDNYYILYAYFLKQRNGIKEYTQQRKKLIDIYSNINLLFGEFEYGGTYFGHQNKRILAYAEYSIYLLHKTKNNTAKTYDISKQKELYIKSLRQLIEDESKIDFNTLGQEKIERTKKLNKIVDQLNELITDNFYLRRAQEFQYEHYEYY